MGIFTNCYASRREDFPPAMPLIAAAPAASKAPASEIHVMDRVTGEEFVEPVYSLKGLTFLYENPGLIAKIVKFFMTHIRLPSMVYGWFMSMGWFSRHMINPFINGHGINRGEFAEPNEGYASFSDFFERRLKDPEGRINPVEIGPDDAIIPADARYRVYQKIQPGTTFDVKGKEFNLSAFLGNEELAKKYEGGSMVIARLAIFDYHRFHFPCDGTTGETRLINGMLYSVSPIALQHDSEIFLENKRYVTTLETSKFGQVLCVDVGATCVGKVSQAKAAGERGGRGEERGHFGLGGSTVVMLFKKDQIQFSQDVLANSEAGKETLCRFGQPMGSAMHPQ